MAGILALAYGLIKGTASVVESVRNDRYKQIITDNAVKNGSLTYSLDGQLYWTENNQPCHIYIDENGVKQIRSGTIYGGGIVLLDYKEELERPYEECIQNKYEQAEKEYLTQNKRYFNCLDYNYDFKEKKRYVTLNDKFSGGKYYISYLVNHNGKWCFDDLCSNPWTEVDYKEWIACGGNCANRNYSFVKSLSVIIKEEDKLKEDELKKKQRLKALEEKRIKEHEMTVMTLKATLVWLFFAIIILELLIYIRNIL